jgi:acyl-coenzyme A synthetase/AMP-(fatty) acid ligase
LADIDPEVPLLRLFTGGSTGAPKSWLKTVENLFGEAFYLAEKYQINKDDLLVATLSPYHIYGLLFSVIIPFISSATVLADSPCFPAEIREATREKATILAAVPAHYRVLKGNRTGGEALRLAFSSAGMLDQADNEDFYQQNNVSVVEVYGSTETGGIASRNRSLGEQCFYPFATVDWQINQERLLLDSAYISPGAERDENGFFTVGDRIEPGPDNCFFLKGRSDAIAKVGGKRVDLEEVRDKIKSQPGVKDCVVVALTNTGGRENMIVALIEGKTMAANELRKNLSTLLEPYALPRQFKNTDNIPMTANGKYDLAAIKQFFK